MISASPTSDAEHELFVSFVGITENKGQVLFKIQNETGRDIHKNIIKVINKTASFNINLPKGKYAVSAFHDANSNEKLDKNMVGFPTEKYGFSNDARGTFGPPELSDQLFTLDTSKKITITLK